MQLFQNIITRKKGSVSFPKDICSELASFFHFPVKDQLTHRNGQQTNPHLDRANGDKRHARAVPDHQPVVRKKGEDETEDVFEDEHARECFDGNFA